MQIVRSVHGGVDKKPQAQFLHRKVSVQKLQNLVDELNVPLIVRIIGHVENKESLNADDTKLLQELFFSHVPDSLKSSLVVLSIAATHSYYNGAYVLRKGYDGACKNQYAKDIIESAKSIINLSSEKNNLFL